MCQIYSANEARDLTVDWPDVYFSPLYCQFSENSWECALNHSQTIIYVYLKDYTDGTYHLYTPYGYAGYYLAPTVTLDELSDFISHFRQLAMDRNYSQEDIRFSPYLVNPAMFSHLYSLNYLRHTYSISITEPDRYLHRRPKKTRNMIRRAIREKVTFEFRPVSASDLTPTSDFRQLYEETMDYHQANHFYYFSDDEYRNLTQLSETYIAIVRDPNHTILTISLFLVFNQMIHYHLSCRGTRAVNYAQPFMFYQLVDWGHRNHKEFIHLGGGRTEDDSLARFKQRLSTHSHDYYSASYDFTE